MAVPGTSAQAAYLDQLIEAGLLTHTGVPGVYARGGGFEQVRLGLDAMITRWSADEHAEPLLFPPLLPREQLETSGYLGSFPHLAGTVFGFDGDEREAQQLVDRASRHEDWSAFEQMTELVLTPAACYPLYPAAAARGALPSDGLTFDTGDAYVFRREPSNDPSRMQIFHMREIVRIGEPGEILEWRERWRLRAAELLRSLGLDIEMDLANDPFFGRSGRLLASAQREQQLKVEMLAPVAGDQRTAIASSNYHQDHFGHTFELTTSAGEPAHTTCIAFGEERIVLALLSAHGFDVREWPQQAKKELGVGA
jgi:seryl-tRNA synthetase